VIGLGRGRSLAVRFQPLAGIGSLVRQKFAAMPDHQHSPKRTAKLRLRDLRIYTGSRPIPPAMTISGKRESLHRLGEPSWRAFGAGPFPVGSSDQRSTRNNEERPDPPNASVAHRRGPCPGPDRSSGPCCGLTPPRSEERSSVPKNLAQKPCSTQRSRSPIRAELILSARLELSR